MTGNILGLFTVAVVVVPSLFLVASMVQDRVNRGK